MMRFYRLAGAPPKSTRAATTRSPSGLRILRLDYDKVFYATHPNTMVSVSNQGLRDRYLIENLFLPGAIRLNYLHQERLVIGGVAPQGDALALPAIGEPASQSEQPFLARREMGVVNIADGAGCVRVDGRSFILEPLDALYIARGAVDVRFENVDPARAARFYLASTPAHAAFETKLVSTAKAIPLERGAAETANHRIIYQLVVPGVCASAQLLLGLTILQPGSVWNTMPPHLHDRRSEAYFYFRLAEAGRVVHFMGEPDATRSVMVANEQAVICPPWSVHCGVGTGSYAFIWAMGGENLDYHDMNPLDICQLR